MGAEDTGGWGDKSTRRDRGVSGGYVGVKGVWSRWVLDEEGRAEFLLWAGMAVLVSIAEGILRPLTGA